MSSNVLKTLKNTQKSMDRWTDGQTDRQTDRVTYRVACRQLKITKFQPSGSKSLEDISSLKKFMFERVGG